MSRVAGHAPALVVALVALALVVQHFVRSPTPEPALHWRRQAGAGLAMLGASVAGAWLVGRPAHVLGVAWPHHAATAGFTALAMAVMVAGSFFASRQPDFRDHYPEAPIERWDRRAWLANAGAWAVYLAGYELLLRGLCLGTLCDAWGNVSGVAVTTAIYVVAHLPKNLSESLGSFPMGVVMAALTLSSGSILPALVLHLVMAVAADTFALRPRDSMRKRGRGDVHPAHPAAEGRGR